MDSNRELAKYRINSANEILADAKLLYDHDSYNSSASRSYYAMFNALRAILALDGRDFKKHSAVISYFQREYIKTRTFDAEISDFVRTAFAIRSDTDYQDFFEVSAEDAKRQIDNAAKVISAVTEYLHRHFD